MGEKRSRSLFYSFLSSERGDGGLRLKKQSSAKNRHKRKKTGGKTKKEIFGETGERRGKKVR